MCVCTYGVKYVFCIFYLLWRSVQCMSLHIDPIQKAGVMPVIQLILAFSFHKPVMIAVHSRRARCVWENTAHILTVNYSLLFAFTSGLFFDVATDLPTMHLATTMLTTSNSLHSSLSYYLHVSVLISLPGKAKPKQCVSCYTI